MKIIGVDIGGSHISAAEVMFSSRNAEIINFQEADVDTFRAKEEIIQDWAAVIVQAAGNDKECQIGIAMPGPYDYENGISLIKDQGKMGALYGLSVKNLLAEQLAIPAANISFTNDAEAFLLGESIAGAGKAFQNSIGITLGTGLGSAIKIHGVVKDGKLWTAPFRDGIAEDYLGTAWFINYAMDHFGLRLTGVKDLLSTDFDQEISKKMFLVFGRSLGEFLFPYLERLHCDGVVLGGKISLAEAYYLPHTKDYIAVHGYSVPFTISTLGERAALIGSCLPFLKHQ
jgi:glucokinase